MRDPEFDSLLDDAKPTASRGHGRKFFLAVFVLTGLWLLCCSIDRPRRSTCAACRLDRLEEGFLGFRWATFEESECSRWYAANVEQSHKHIWAKHGHCRRVGIPGFYSGFACSMGEPITGLGKSFQLRVYQRFREPMEAKSLFVRLGQRNGENKQELMDGLSEWMDSGGSESWDEWWRMHRPIDQ